MEAFVPLRRWLFFVFLLTVIAGATALAFERDLYDVYVWEFVAPGLQKEFGFRIGNVRIRRDNTWHEVPGIVAVEPGGIFDQAGFRPGDIPVGYQHGFVGFYQHLRSARGKEATLRILRPEDAGGWTKIRERSVAIR